MTEKRKIVHDPAAALIAATAAVVEAARALADKLNAGEHFKSERIALNGALAALDKEAA